MKNEKFAQIKNPLYMSVALALGAFIPFIGALLFLLLIYLNKEKRLTFNKDETFMMYGAFILLLIYAVINTVYSLKTMAPVDNPSTSLLLLFI